MQISKKANIGACGAHEWPLHPVEAAAFSALWPRPLPPPNKPVFFHPPSRQPCVSHHGHTGPPQPAPEQHQAMGGFEPSRSCAWGQPGRWLTLWPQPTPRLRVRSQEQCHQARREEIVWSRLRWERRGKPPRPRVPASALMLVPPQSPSAGPETSSVTRET